MQTETQNPNTTDLDQMTTTDILRLMNQEDRIVIDAVAKAIPQITKAIDSIRDHLARSGRLIYVGAGTSGRLGILDAVECVPTFNVMPENVQGFIAGGQGAVIKSVEGAEDNPQAGQQDLQSIGLNASDVVVGIAASGRTPYVLGAIEYARAQDVMTIGISCNDPAPLLDAVDIPIAAVVGSEVLTGSTRLKAGTAQKMILNMISTATFVQLGKVYGNLMVDVQVTNEKLAQRATGIIQQITGASIDTAQTLLQAANNNVKVAIVMHERNIDYASAVNQLAQVNGNLRAIIGDKDI